MSGPAESSRTATGNLINVVKIFDNTKGMRVADEKVDVATFERLLTDAGRVDCPLLAAVGYPVIIASTSPGQKCIPVVQMPPRSRNPHNNRLATTAASRVSSGLAMGCVVGDVYMLRQDGKHLTSKEWWELWDTLMSLMDKYGEETSAAEVARRLLETAVLKPEQVIARNVAPPPLPNNMTPKEAVLARVMPPDQHSIFLYNKDLGNKDGICLGCRTHYRLLESPPPGDKAAAEQELSGICSYACFQKLAPSGPNSGPEWYGQSAEAPEGMTYMIG
eukprot:gene13791-13912_t